MIMGSQQGSSSSNTHPLERIRKFTNRCFNALILCKFYEIGAGETVPSHIIVDELGEEVENPATVIRTTLARLAKWGLLQKQGRGLYKPTLDYEEKLVLSVICKRCREQ